MATIKQYFNAPLHSQNESWKIEHDAHRDIFRSYAKSEPQPRKLQKCLQLARVRLWMCIASQTFTRQHGDLDGMISNIMPCHIYDLVEDYFYYHKIKIAKSHHIFLVAYGIYSDLFYQETLLDFVEHTGYGL